MKAIMVMFDSLNRHMLEPYGCDWVKTPNFSRLARRSVTFDNSFVGSMPCMPARRELHTGRYNFLHRSWGPLEPFDDSMPEILQKNGIVTHLVSDHYHYWEDGGATYHGRYSNWQFSRGQEGDLWKGDMKDPSIPRPNPASKWARGRQDWVNRSYMQAEKDQPQPQTFAAGLEFIEKNHDCDKWFLHIETFDPHEPYFVNDNYRNMYPRPCKDLRWDWPGYGKVKESPAEVAHMRYQNAALVTMCDRYLGKVLDMMDKYDLWKDTMLIVNTDHGFLLGEHDFWAKCVMPFYNEIARTPLFIWDPRSGARNARRESLVQTIDLPATLLEFFGIALPPDMQGVPLRRTVERDRPVRKAGLFGIHGGHVNCTDGRYVYMRAPAGPGNEPLNQYTHMPTHMRGFFGVDEMRTARLSRPFSFTKGCPVLKIRPGTRKWIDAHGFGTMLFDIKKDPAQKKPLNNAKIEKKMVAHMVRLMRENDCPPEQFKRLGLRDA
ncbi:MAG: sulfatase [Verrucomicrobia bacterium]|nr:sulfatase [Verrucomicrobiota bacterium]